MDMFRFTGFAEKWGFNMGFINFAYEIEFCTSKFFSYTNRITKFKLKICLKH